MIYDVEKEKEVFQYPATSCVGQISYRRLVEILRRSGEISPNEEITYIEVSNYAIKYGVKNKCLKK